MGDLGVERKIMLKLILKEWNGRMRTGITCLRTGSVEGSLNTVMSILFS